MTTDQLFDLIQKMSEELTFLRKMVFLQQAKADALETLAIARLADLSGVDRKRAFDHFNYVFRDIYDRLILQIGDKYPQYAEGLDARPDFPEHEREQWDFPTDTRSDG